MELSSTEQPCRGDPLMSVIGATGLNADLAINARSIEQ